MDLLRLRRETAADHEAVEGSVPLMGPSLNRLQYVDCLRRMFTLVAAWEDEAATVAPAWLAASLAARRRSGMLAEDLGHFGVSLPCKRAPLLPRMQTEATLLGTMYVMEGSTLGGQLIARHVQEVLGLQEGQGNAYFRGHGAQTGTMWKEFCEILRSRVDSDHEDEVIAAARAMFRTFGTWMRGDETASGADDGGTRSDSKV